MLLAVVERHGISRHVVRFVEYDGTFYALKEINHEAPAHRIPFRALATSAPSPTAGIASIELGDSRLRGTEHVPALDRGKPRGQGWTQDQRLINAPRTCPLLYFYGFIG